jgi:hypothetical protein
MIQKEMNWKPSYHQFVGWINRDRFDLRKNSIKIGHGIAILEEHIPKVIEELKKEGAQ